MVIKKIPINRLIFYSLSIVIMSLAFSVKSFAVASSFSSLMINFNHAKLSSAKNATSVLCFVLSSGEESFEDTTLSGAALFTKYADTVATTCQRIRGKATFFQVDNLAPGDYAIRAFIDENGNGELDTNLLGIPKEAVLASGEGGLGPPRFSRSTFVVGGDTTIIDLSF